MKIEHVASEGTKGELSSPFLLDPTVEKERANFFKKWRVFRERSCTGQEAKLFASGQEAKLFYAAKAMCGHWFWEVSTTPRGRGILLLDSILV